MPRPRPSSAQKEAAISRLVARCERGDWPYTRGQRMGLLRSRQVSDAMDRQTAPLTSPGEVADALQALGLTHLTAAMQIHMLGVAVPIKTIRRRISHIMEGKREVDWLLPAVLALLLMTRHLGPLGRVDFRKVRDGS